MAQDPGDLGAVDGTPALGMAIGRRNDYLHILSLDTLLAQRDWDLAKVELIDESGRPIPWQRPHILADNPVGEEVTASSASYRQRLLGIAHGLADRIESDPSMRAYAAAVTPLRTLDGSLAEMMAFFVGPAPLPVGSTGRVEAAVPLPTGGLDADPVDSGGFWHNLWHKAFG